LRFNVFFASADEMRDWLEAHHETHAELWVGIRRSGAGGSGLTLTEALDEGMCFGWVNTMTWRIGEDSSMVRFTPGPPRDTARAAELRAEGRMHPAGIRALERQR
jgi:uncharacterized protein YdeI (YjbR/CyaY-like superfamily)